MSTITRHGMAARYSEASVFNGVIYLAGMVPEGAATDIRGQTQNVLAQIDAIEALGIATIDVSPVYWRTLGNRLAARLPLPEYTTERHAAWLAGRTWP